MVNTVRTERLPGREREMQALPILARTSGLIMGAFKQTAEKSHRVNKVNGVFPCHLNTRLRDIGQRHKNARISVTQSVIQSMAWKRSLLRQAGFLLDERMKDFMGAGGRLPKIGPLSEWKIGMPESSETLYQTRSCSKSCGTFLPFVSATLSSHLTVRFA
jgi:hypothetical protein